MAAALAVISILNSDHPNIFVHEPINQRGEIAIRARKARQIGDHDGVESAGEGGLAKLQDARAVAQGAPEIP